MFNSGNLFQKKFLVVANSIYSKKIFSGILNSGKDLRQIFM